MNTDLFPQTTQLDPAQLARAMEQAETNHKMWIGMTSDAWQEYNEAIDNDKPRRVIDELFDHAMFAREQRQEAQKELDEIKAQILLGGYPADLFFPRRNQFIELAKNIGVIAEVE
jgi:hypothetical protein